MPQLFAPSYLSCNDFATGVFLYLSRKPKNLKTNKEYFRRVVIMKEVLKAILKVLKFPVWGIIAFLLLIAGQEFVGAKLTSLIPEYLMENDAVSTASMYLAFIGIWIVALAWMGIFKWSRPIIKAIGTKASGNNLKNLGIGLLIGGGLNLICALVAMLNKDIAITYDSFRPISFIAIFICVFIQSAAEELICRGYLYQKLRKTYNNPWVAIIGNAVFFGLIHLANPGISALAIVNIIVAGIFFSLMVYYMDSIWCAMAAHAAWNFMQNIVLGLPNSGNVFPYSVFSLDAANARDSWAYNVGFGVEGTLFADALLIVGCIVLIIWGRKSGKKALNVWAK